MSNTQLRFMADLNGLAAEAGHGTRVSLSDLLEQLSFYKNMQTGTISLVHASGSFVRFSAEGHVEVSAERSLALNTKSYAIIGEPDMDEAQLDWLGLKAVADGHPAAIEQLVHSGRVPHLQEQARAVAVKHGHIA